MAPRSAADRGLARRVLSRAMNSEEVAVANLSCAKKAPAEAWAVVMYFYAAVHAVNHHRFGKANVPASFKHWERNQHVMLELPAVDGKYRALVRLAHDARYHAHLLPLNEQHVAKAKELAVAVFGCAGVTVPSG